MNIMLGYDVHVFILNYTIYNYTTYLSCNNVMVVVYAAVAELEVLLNGSQVAGQARKEQVFVPSSQLISIPEYESLVTLG